MWSLLDRLHSKSNSGVCGVDKICKGDRHFYLVHTRSSAVETFQALVERDLEKLKSSITAVSTFSRDNLTQSERHALKSLSPWGDIVIREADKGGSVVVLDSEDYNREALRQLNDTTTYHILHVNPTNIFKI